jgi:hypothetical protein
MKESAATVATWLVAGVGSDSEPAETAYLSMIFLLDFARMLVGVA